MATPKVTRNRAVGAENQVPPLVNYNLFLSDPVLTAAVRREDAAWAEPQIAELGQFLGTEEVQRCATTRMRIRRFCTRTTATGIGATKLSFILHGTT